MLNEVPARRRRIHRMVLLGATTILQQDRCPPASHAPRIPASGPGTVNLRLSAVRRLAYEASDCGLLSPDLAAGIRRVKGVKRLGVRIGNWLTAEEGRRMIDAFSASALKQRRN